MTPHKLMIGDWVEAEVQVDDTGTEPVFEKLRKRVTDIYTIGHRVEISLEDNVQFGATLSQIRLTPEILEANNFQEDFEHSGIYWRPDCRKFCFVKELDDWYFAIRYGGGHICIAECNHVYKFRHILRDLLEIETEVYLD